MKKMLVLVFAMVFCASVGIATAEKKETREDNKAAKAAVKDARETKSDAKGKAQNKQDQGKAAAKGAGK